LDPSNVTPFLIGCLSAADHSAGQLVPKSTAVKIGAIWDGGFVCMYPPEGDRLWRAYRLIPSRERLPSGADPAHDAAIDDHWGQACWR